MVDQVVPVVLVKEWAVGNIGAEDDGILQALAAVDGDDTHGLGIAFEAKFFRFYVGFFRGDPAFDPSHQWGRAKPSVARFCMDELCGMQQVCHEPFAIWP